MTRPVVALTEAIPDEEVVQVPPSVVSASSVVCPIHTAAVPVIGPGSGLTVILREVLQIPASV